FRSEHEEAHTARATTARTPATSRYFRPPGRGSRSRERSNRGIGSVMALGRGSRAQRGEVRRRYDRAVTAVKHSAIRDENEGWDAPGRLVRLGWRPASDRPRGRAPPRAAARRSRPRVLGCAPPPRVTEPATCPTRRDALKLAAHDANPKRLARGARRRR